MTTVKRSTIILSLLLAACVHAPQQVAEQAEKPASQAEKPSNLPKLELTQPMLYEFLMGDVASQRGQQGMAAQIYLELAYSTRDPRVASRAAHLAYSRERLASRAPALSGRQRMHPSLGR